jgi:hypothetical protein
MGHAGKLLVGQQALVDEIVVNGFGGGSTDRSEDKPVGVVSRLSGQTRRQKGADQTAAMMWG